MISYLLLAATAFSLYYAFDYYRALSRNIAEAKKSGLPYVVLPVYAYNRLWLVTHPIWIKYLKKLPESWTEPWLDFVNLDWLWRFQFGAFEKVGSDAFILVTPQKCILQVANAEAIAQITLRRNDFPKPIEMYRSVNLFGKNVVSTEGQYWRHHRKITSPPFTEKNNHLVWEESLHAAQMMLNSWMDSKDAEESRTIKQISADTMRLSLHVISRAGFGVRLRWPQEEGKAEDKKGMSSAEVPPGHTLSYKDALSTLLDNLPIVMLTPSKLLPNLPFKKAQIAYESYREWRQYMTELFEAKKAEIQSGDESDGGLDLMGALVKGAGIKAEKDLEKGAAPPKQLLSDDEILGNAFVFMLAGHETTANTLHFAFLFLALHWESQQRLHKDMDEIFRGRPVDEWDYESDIAKLFGSMAGAVMNEELRLIPPVLGIPKSTPKDQPQPLTIDGRRVVVPAGANVVINTSSVHRNPKYWLSKEGKPFGPDEPNDLQYFHPERWLVDGAKDGGHVSADSEASESEGDVGGPQGRDTASALFRPARGAYVPFSEGYRACLGRRFAQVEVLAVLALLFKDYSVELAVDEWATDEQVDAMPKNGPERRELWEKAAESCRYKFKHNMMTMITLQMKGTYVPIRFVKRGKERFAFS